MSDATPGQVAQLVEQETENLRVGGSIPSLATPRSWRAIPRDELEAAVARCHFAADVIRSFGLPVGGNSYRALAQRVRRWELDTSHWRGTRPRAGQDLASVLVPGGYTNRWRLKRRLIAAGILRNECAECGQGPSWKGRTLVLVLDHINGVNDDYRPENLRLLCPNCNSQTPTFAGRNMRRRRR